MVGSEPIRHFSSGRDSFFHDFLSKNSARLRQNIVGLVSLVTVALPDVAALDNDHTRICLKIGHYHAARRVII